MVEPGWLRCAGRLRATRPTFSASRRLRVAALALTLLGASLPNRPAWQQASALGGRLVPRRESLRPETSDPSPRVPARPERLPQVPATSDRSRRVPDNPAVGTRPRNLVPVPELRRKTELDARRALRSVGLVAGRVTSRESRARTGTVIAQQPPPETPVDRGTAVSFVIAAEPAPPPTARPSPPATLAPVAPPLTARPSPPTTLAPVAPPPTARPSPPTTLAKPAVTFSSASNGDGSASSPSDPGDPAAGLTWPVLPWIGAFALGLGLVGAVISRRRAATPQTSSSAKTLHVEVDVAWWPPRLEAASPGLAGPAVTVRTRPGAATMSVVVEGDLVAAEEKHDE